MLLVIFILLLFFICCFSSFTFSFRHHPSPFCGLSRGFYAHFVLSARPIAEWFATLSFSTIPLSSYCERYSFEWAFLTHSVFYLTLLRNILAQSAFIRLPWELAVIPWNLQGFILVLEAQIQPICLFDSQ